MSVEIATRAARAQVVETVVAAFRADPAFHFFFAGADAETFAQYTAVFAEHLFDRRVDLGTVWVAEGGTAVAMWDGPDQVGESDADVDLPPDARDRIVEYEHALEPMVPPGRLWYLGVLATHPDAAGRRLGREVMAAGVRRAHEDGLAAYLETTNSRNVGIYERAGWTQVTATEIRGMPVWLMRNEP